MAEITKADVVSLISEILEKNGWSAARLAREAGVSPSTVTRALSPDTKFIPSARTLSKIINVLAKDRVSAVSGLASVFDQYHGELQVLAAQNSRIAILGRVQPKAWFELDQTWENNVEYLEIVDTALKPRPWSAYQVVGDRAGPSYPNGSFVITAPWQPDDPLYEGDVLVLRRRIDTTTDSIFETALWSVATTSGGFRLSLLSDPFDDHIEYVGEILAKSRKILGLVVALYYRLPRTVGNPTYVPKGADD